MSYSFHSLGVPNFRYSSSIMSLILPFFYFTFSLHIPLIHDTNLTILLCMPSIFMHLILPRQVPLRRDQQKSAPRGSRHYCISRVVPKIILPVVSHMCRNFTRIVMKQEESCLKSQPKSSSCRSIKINNTNDMDQVPQWRNVHGDAIQFVHVMCTVTFPTSLS